MSAASSTVGSPARIGEKAPGFRELPGVDGKRYGLSSFDGKRLLVIIFTANGCPAAKAAEERVIAIQADHAEAGVQLVAINANNPYLSPPDTYAEMVKRAQEKKFNFPYLKDEGRDVARRYGAICTPHAFALDGERRLRYRGRIDDSRDPSRVTIRDLENAIEDLLAGGEVKVPETQPFGCSIVW